MSTKKNSARSASSKGTAGKHTYKSLEATFNAPLKGKLKGKRVTQAKAPTKAEKKRLEAANPAPAKKTKTKPVATVAAKPKREPKPRKLSLINAAHQLLAETGAPMNCKDLVTAIGEKGLWASPAGKTPHATLYAAILREIATKGEDARFKKTDRGRFAANA